MSDVERTYFRRRPSGIRPLQCLCLMDELHAKNTPPPCWPWNYRWLRTRVHWILENSCISTPIQFCLSFRRKHAYILVNIDIKLDYPFGVHSKSHPITLTRKAVYSSDNFRATVWADKKKWGKIWRRYTEIIFHVEQSSIKLHFDLNCRVIGISESQNIKILLVV